MPDFSGFNNEKYRDEVIERWGQEAWDRSQAWWDSFSEDDKADFAATHERLQDAYDAAQNSGLPIEDPRVQAIVATHDVLFWERAHIIELRRGYRQRVTQTLCQMRCLRHPEECRT